MKRWSIQVLAVWLLSLAVIFGCGGERRSGSVPAGDTAAVTPPETAAVSAPETAATRVPDTAAARARDTVTRRDTTRATPPVARSTPPPKPAPKPAARQPQPAAPKPPQASDTSTAAAPSADSSAAATPPSNQANAPLRDPYHQAPLDTVSQTVYDGWKQFNLNCARCHGEDVQGTTIAPHLLVSLRPDGPINTKELFMQTVCAGRPEKGMPSWCALGMDMAKIESIYSYVKGRSDGKIHPGRPALQQKG
jgi:hypothetical protein